VTIYDEAIKALQSNEPELAILIIKQIVDGIAKAKEKEVFELQPTIEPVLEKSTAFLNFNGWEAA